MCGDVGDYEGTVSLCAISPAVFFYLTPQKKNKVWRNAKNNKGLRVGDRLEADVVTSHIVYQQAAGL